MPLKIDPASAIADNREVMRTRHPDFAGDHFEPFLDRPPAYRLTMACPPPKRFWLDPDRINSELRPERMCWYHHYSTQREDFLRVSSCGLRMSLRFGEARPTPWAWT